MSKAIRKTFKKMVVGSSKQEERCGLVQLISCYCRIQARTEAEGA